MGISIITELKEELEKPRGSRPLGSGWLSGCGALLSGIVAVLLLSALHFQEWLSVPELKFAYDSGYIEIALRIVLIIGYLNSLISLLLSRNKILGAVALLLVVTCALIGEPQAAATAEKPLNVYFGLDFFIVNVLFTGFIFIPFERFFPHKRKQTVFRPEWQEDMFYYLVSSMLVQILGFLALAPANFVNTTFDFGDIRSNIMALPFIVQLFIIMFLTDFVQYWLHRAFHTFPVLWRFHAVHHSAKSMDWLAGARMHFLEIVLLRGLTAVPMFTLGFAPEAIQLYLLIVYVYSSFVHANVGFDLRRLERLVVTPRFHHWHHGSEREAIDINYAIHFPLFDWLFGTYHMPEKAWPKQYGVAGDEPVPNGYIKQFLYPFKRKKKTALPEAAE